MILPKGNEKNLVDVPERVRGEMEFVFAGRIEDALGAVIPELADRLAAADSGERLS